MKKKLIVENVHLTDAGSKGKGVGRMDDGRVIMVDGAVPGDVVDVMVTRKKAAFWEGRTIALKTPSPHRVQPVCKHFDLCGGCRWQNLEYDKQLFFKQKEVFVNLKKIAGTTDYEELPILPSEDIFFYRNKLEFTFSNKRWLTNDELISDKQFDNRNGLGYHMPGMWDKVLNITECHLQRDPSNGIREFLRSYSNKNNIPFFDLRNQEGLLRTVIIRTSLAGETMVIIQFFEDWPTERTQLLDALQSEFPEITSLLYVINPKQNDTFYDLKVHLHSGRGYMIEEMPSYFEPNKKLRFKVGPKSFYQTNPKQAFHLYKTALDFAGLTGNEVVYDLYTGTGTIALFMAQMAKKVVGIEAVPEAIEDAFFNAQMNELTNVDFVAGDMRFELNDAFIAKYGKPDVIITDPPRIGMHESVVNTILNLAPKKVVYVSCNSATQARDVGLMKEKYKLIKSRAVDMFPHTHHIESVILLEKIDNGKS